MSQIPPYQMSAPPGGPPPKNSNTKIWVWVLVGLAGMCVLCGIVGAAILLPVISQGRTIAKERLSLSASKQVALSTIMYCSDNDDLFPPIKDGPDVAERIWPYLPDKNDPVSPSRPRITLKARAASYTWNKELSAFNQSMIENQNELWMFHSNEPLVTSRICLAFASGIAKLIKQDELTSKTNVKLIKVKSKK